MLWKLPLLQPFNCDSTVLKNPASIHNKSLFNHHLPPRPSDKFTWRHEEQKRTIFFQTVEA
uniref:Uncharacterized protein n=1 Tax=Romanomermis culicivorax TaxID=13658 RepID=A0A915JCP5_ROMCU